MDTYPNEDALSDITEASIASHQTSMTVRKKRMSDPEDKLVDETTEQILGKLEEVVQKKVNVEQEEKTRALSKIREVFADTKQALDIAYSAGILTSKTPGYARADSIQYAANFPGGKMKEVLGEARIYLKSTIIAIKGLAKDTNRDSEVPELTNSFLQHWLEADTKLLKQAGDLMKKLKTP